MTLLELLGLPRLTCPYSSIRTCPYLHGPDSHAHECGAVESRGCVSPNPSLLITSHMRCARIPWSLTSGQPQAHTKYMHCQGLQKVGDSFTDFALPGKHSPAMTHNKDQLFALPEARMHRSACGPLIQTHHALREQEA
eukprot:scaffold140863_cov22-Tisochrysis_lutea.AAC.1